MLAGALRAGVNENVLRLSDIDLSCDPLAGRFVKSEVVEVSFATEPGVLVSRVGPNHYAAGDALIVGCDGDRWSVKRAVFDAKYRPEPGTIAGQAGSYRNVPSPVHARQYAQAFAVTRTSGDVLHGRPGDWLLQYGKGDHGIADAGRFARVYRAIED